MPIIAKYDFKDYDGWQAARGRLYEELGHTNYNDSIEPKSYDSGYIIEIYDACNSPRVANKICEANGGEAY